MRDFRFRSSLKKGPARKASGPGRHTFDSAEPITTPLIPKHPESGILLIASLKISNASNALIGLQSRNRRVIGARVV